MKKLFLFFIAAFVFAQGGKIVDLSWTDNANPAGTSYNIKRATGLCTGSPNFSTIATGVTSKAYTDTGVGIGTYCYAVTASFNNIESTNSPTASATVPPREVAELSVVVR